MVNLVAGLTGFALFAAALLCVPKAVAQARTPQGAVAWAIFLVAAPWAALPTFLVFGPHRMRAAQKAVRNADAALADRSPDAAPADGPGPAAPQGRGDRADAAAGAAHAAAADLRLRPFEALAGRAAVGGNAAEPLIDGHATFEAIFAAIDAARHSVEAQFFIIADDALGQDFAHRLAEAARRGVRVRLLFDQMGSYRLSRRYVDRLRDAGVRLPASHGRLHRVSGNRINLRNHRKVVIVDGAWAALGGHNVAEKYLGRDPRMGRWRDTHLAVRGPVVAQLLQDFDRDWHWHTGERPQAPAPPAPPDAADLRALAIAMGPADRVDTGALFFVAAIGRARRRIWIATPYFVPDIDTLSALKCAALAGCDVRILMPDRIDHYLPWLAAFAFFDEVRAAGVAIHRYRGGFLHQKVVLIDDDLAAIGTANLDNRSFRLNFETMVLVQDRGFADRVEAMLRADLADAPPLEQSLSEQGVGIRIGARLARLLAPVL